MVGEIQNIMRLTWKSKPQEITVAQMEELREKRINRSTTGNFENQKSFLLYRF